MPMDRSRYGTNWEKVSRTIRRIAGWRCEFCGVANGSPLRSGRPGKVVLTVAHLGAPLATGQGWVEGCKHDKHDVRRENLKAACQACHLALDLPDHIAHARETRQRKRHERITASGQMSMF
jgi:hypothetical protein